MQNIYHLDKELMRSDASPITQQAKTKVIPVT